MNIEKKSISEKWMDVIWTKKIPSHSKFICAYLSEIMRANNDIVARPSYSRMIDDTGLSKSTISRCMNTLESEGWITRERSKRGGNTTYRISLPSMKYAPNLSLETSLKLGGE